MDGSVNCTEMFFIPRSSAGSSSILIGMAVAFFACGLASASDPVAPAAMVVDASSDQLPPAPIAARELKTEADAEKPADPADLSLDALLEIAEKDPERLQTVNVKTSANDRLLNPDLVFKPDAGAGTAANSTGELLSRALGVVTRSTSALNQDARLRGYSGSQVVGIANGMNQTKGRIDVDSLFSQIDPNIVESVTVIPGPYAVEYGPERDYRG